MLPADVLESPAGLREHLNNCGPVGTLLPTLASRRLEHCLQLSRRLAECEKMKISLQKCNERLEKDLEVGFPCNRKAYLGMKMVSEIVFYGILHICSIGQ